MKLDYSKALLKEDVLSYQERVNEVHQSIFDGTCAGNDFIGWVRWPFDYDKEEFARIKEEYSKNIKAKENYFAEKENEQKVETESAQPDRKSVV